MENQQAFEYETEMATLDLKGKRYRNAVEKFSDLARLTNNAMSWVGLGIAKLGLITEDVTVLEVFHCFSKARMISENKSDINTISLEASKEAIKQLYDVYTKATIMERTTKGNAAKQLITSVVVGVFTVGSRIENDKLGYMAGAGLSALSYMGYIESKKSVESLQDAIKVIQELINEVTQQALDFNKENSNEKEISDFTNFVRETKDSAIELTKTEEEKKNDEIRKVDEEKMKQKYLSVEDAAEIINDDKHIYHLYKKDAKALHKEGKLAEAYEKISYANQIYSLEEEVSILKQQYEDELKQKHAQRYKKDKRVFLIFMIIVFAISLIDSNDIGEVGSNLFYMAIFGGTVLVYRKVVRDNMVKKPTDKE